MANIIDGESNILEWPLLLHCMPHMRLHTILYFQYSRSSSVIDKLKQETITLEIDMYMPCLTFKNLFNGNSCTFFVHVHYAQWISLQDDA